MEPDGVEVTTSRASRRADVSLVAAAALGLAVLGLVYVHRVSPYIDTAFQMRISHRPTLGGFGGAVAADNQAPGAQFLYWLGAKLGLSSTSDQRLLSLVLASGAYVGAVSVGCRLRVGPSTPSWMRVDPLRLALTGLVVSLASGVFVISTMARYSSLVGPSWLLLFLLAVRVCNGDDRATRPLGLALGLSILIAYSMSLAAVGVVVALLLTRVTRSLRTLLTVAVAMVVGLLPVLGWLLYAGSDHLHRIGSRVDPTDSWTARSVVGRAYELGAWLLTGPVSLPVPVGAFALAVLAGSYLWFLGRAPQRTWLPWVCLVSFVALPIPLLFATRTATGWSMVGPAAVLACSVCMMGSYRRAAITLIGLNVVVLAMLTADVAVLRPDVYAGRADQAVHLALAAAAPGTTLVAGDWTLELLAREQAKGTPVRVRDMAGFLKADTAGVAVVLVFQDPGTSSPVGDQRRIRSWLGASGYRRILRRAVAPYDHMSLRRRLGLVSFESQYTVETWRSADRS